MFICGWVGEKGAAEVFRKNMDGLVLFSVQAAPGFSSLLNKCIGALKFTQNMAIQMNDESFNDIRHLLSLALYV